MSTANDSDRVVIVTTTFTTSLSPICSKVGSIKATILKSVLLDADYFLWALQRLYEKDEDRYWETVRQRAKVVYDMDDKRSTSYGVYYTAAKPLTLAARAKK